MQGTAARQAQGDGSQKLAPDPDPEACKRASPSIVRWVQVQHGRLAIETGVA